MILVGQADTVFLLRKGATLKNAIIGKNQGEGVYCIGGGCTIENVWFEDVCEDAISMYSPPPLPNLYLISVYPRSSADDAISHGSKEDTAGTVTRIIGGGAYHASDKIVQHNGCGSVSVSN